MCISGGGRKEKDMFDVLKKLKFFFKKNKARYGFSFVAMIISGIAAVIIPYIIGRFIDAIVTGEMNLKS